MASIQTSNTSPWLAALSERNPYPSIIKDANTDICIVGGGLAGCFTAYHLLQDTDKHICIVESGKIARGASGYNAGFATTHFQKDFSKYVDMFGLEKAINTQAGIFDAEKDLVALLGILKDAGFPVVYNISEEIVTFTDNETMYRGLKDIYNLKQGGLSIEPLWISPNVFLPEEIRSKYAGCYKVMPYEEIAKKSQLRGTEIMAIELRSATLVNTAELCEQLIRYMLKKYTTTFSVFEYAAIKDISITQNEVILTTNDSHNIYAKEAILCTNGYNTLAIHDNTTDNTGYKNNFVRGYISHMLGYTTPEKYDPTISIYMAASKGGGKTVFGEAPFYFISTRDYKDTSLCCIGGESITEENTDATKMYVDMPAQKEWRLEKFVKERSGHTAGIPFTHRFKWHGTIGLTPDGLRIVGKDPHHPRLRYNLACNSIGVLPSLYGAQKISAEYTNKPTKPCLFDPHEYNT